MSEDQTKILSDNQNQASENEKAATTNPMLEAILVRVIDLAEALNSFRAEVNERFAKVDERFDEVRRDAKRVEMKFDEVEGSLYTSRSEMSSLKHKQKELEIRIEDLERKAS